MIKQYCKLGINHHLLFPGVLKDSSLHEKTLYSLLEMDEFEVVDLSLPADGQVRKREITMLQESKKEIIYNFPLFCLESDAYDVNSSDEQTRMRTLARAKEHLEYAAEAGARYVTFASGKDRGPEIRETLRKAFIEYSCLFGEEAEKYGITALIEPFDRSLGKNLLIGPTREAVEYIEVLRRLGVNNIALMVDMGHVPLMRDSFREAVTLSLPYLYHVHVGNCVMKDPSSVYYGDMHPPLGIDGGENDMPELIEFLSILLEAGYLKKQGKNFLSIEMQPYPGVSSKLSARVGYEKLNAALREYGQGGKT